MTTATVLSFSLIGLDPRPVTVEVDCSRGAPSFDLVGLPDASVRESRVRVRAALHRLGVELDEYRVTVRLAPADLKKRGGGGFDLAVALGVLCALGEVPQRALDGTAVLGELSLTGAIKHVRGVLPVLRGAAAHGAVTAIVPAENAAEAAHVTGIEARGAGSIADVVAHLTSGPALPRPTAPPIDLSAGRFDVDLSEMRGQHTARRALEIAAAGGHNLLLMGPPGCGKTMAARRMPTILPPLSAEEALEITALHSIAGLVPGAGLVSTRPFRSPHHTISSAGLIGGGDPIRPGEVSLAHHGCLFLDDLPEYRRAVIEALREPLAEGRVTICRSRERVSFPAKPLIVAAANPCPCGHHGDLSTPCECGPERVADYQRRMPPLLDHLDIRVRLPAVRIADLRASQASEPSSQIRRRVVQARGAQQARGALNAALPVKELRRLVPAKVWSDAGRAGPLLDGGAVRARVERVSRTLDAVQLRVLRVARTIADLDGAGAVSSAHIAEAVTLTGLP